MTNNTKILSAANIYTAIAVLFTIRRYLIMPSVISRVFFLLFFLLSLYYTIKTIAEFGKFPVVRMLFILVILFGLYGFLLILIPPDTSWLRFCGSSQFLTDFYESLLPIFAFVYFSKKGMITPKWMFGWTFVFIGAAIIKYMGMQTEAIDAAITGDEEVVSRNAGYTFVSLIPCVPFFSNKKILKYILWAGVLLAIIFATKRGAILICVLAFMFYFWNDMRQSRRGSRVSTVLFVGVLLYFISLYVQHLLETTNVLAYQINKTLEGGSSQRDVIYSSYFHFYFNESNLFELLFGHGAYGTLHYLGLMAHNDWLELAIDMGLLGIVAYSVYWIRVWKIGIKSRKECPEDVYMSLLLFAFAYFTKSWFSMSVMSIPIFAAVPFGYCIGQYYRVCKK